jgi:hypothetical protein
MSTANVPEPIQGVEIDWFAEGDVVTVTPRDQKRFEIQKDRAIQILQIADERGKQFEFLVDRLVRWISDNENGIDNAYLTLQDGTLAFVVVRRETRYDEDFQDELADLDFAIANDTELDLIRLKTLALPNVGPTALKSFLDQRLILSFHGQRSRSHQPGKP